MDKKILLQQVCVLGLALCGAIAFYYLVSPSPTGNADTFAIITAKERRAKRRQFPGASGRYPETSKLDLTTRNISLGIIVIMVVVIVLYTILFKPNVWKIQRHSQQPTRPTKTNTNSNESANMRSSYGYHSSTANDTLESSQRAPIFRRAISMESSSSNHTPSQRVIKRSQSNPKHLVHYFAEIQADDEHIQYDTSRRSSTGDNSESDNMGVATSLTRVNQPLSPMVTTWAMWSDNLYKPADTSTPSSSGDNNKNGDTTLKLTLTLSTVPSSKETE